MKKLLLLVAFVLGAIAAANAQQPLPPREAAWNVLDKSLFDSGSDHARQALDVLGTIPEDKDAVTRAVRALGDKDTLTRQAAALALGHMKAREAIPDLQRALDDSGEVAFAAAKALTEIGDSSGRDMLLAVLAGDRKDTPGFMTNATRKAKEKLHHPEGLLLMGATDAAGAMVGPAAAAIPATKNAIGMKGKTDPGRAAAIEYLAKTCDDYSVTLLEWALNDDSYLVRYAAAKALGDRGANSSVAKLIPLLSDSNNIVRDTAAVSMIRVMDRNGAAQDSGCTQIALK